MAETSGVRLYEMAREGDMTDIALVVQGKEIAAHSAMAASRGGALKDLLKANILKAHPDKRVNIGDDIEPQIFETVLKYIYTDAVNICDENLFDIVFAAKKLRLKDLEKRCAEFLKTKVSDENVVNLAEQALQFGSEDCAATCLEYFETNTQSLIKSARFLELSKGVLGKLWERRNLDCSDAELFSACVKWAEKECQRNKTGTSPEEMRTALGEIIPKIRFSHMTHEDVMKIVVPTGILSDETLGRVIYSVVNNPMIKVTICQFCDYDEITENFKSGTSVREIKTYISNEWAIDDPRSFSLAHNGKQLSDDTSLASLYTGEDLELDIHSYQVTVKSGESIPDSFEFPLVIQGQHHEHEADIIDAYVDVILDLDAEHYLKLNVLQPDGTLLSCSDENVYPGGTVIVEVIYEEVYEEEFQLPLEIEQD